MKTTAQLSLLDAQLSFLSEPEPDEAALIDDDHTVALLENAERLAVAMCPSLADTAPAPWPRPAATNHATVGFCLHSAGYEILLIGGGQFGEWTVDCPGTTEQHRREAARAEALALAQQTGALYIGED